MATAINVNGKIVTRPGVYTLTVSGVRNPPASLPYGNVCIIDNGLGGSWGGGVGNTAYPFNTPQDFQNFVKGGPLWQLAKPLFKPGNGFTGVSTLTLIQARDTTAATIDFTIASGACSFDTKDQGINANGVLDGGGILRNGYGATIAQVNAPVGSPLATHTVVTPASSGVAEVDTVVASVIHVGDTFSVTVNTHTVSFTATTTSPSDVYDGLVAALNANSTIATILTPVNSGGTELELTANVVDVAFTATATATLVAGQFQFKFYHGTFVGIDSLNNIPYNNTLESNSAPILLTQSPAVSTLDQLAAWAATDPALNIGFIPNVGTGPIVASDLSSNVGVQVADGGTEDYTDDDFATSLSIASKVDNSIFLSLDYGSLGNMTSTQNESILEMIHNGKYMRFLVIGGAPDLAGLVTDSFAAAAEYNDDQAIIIHGDGKLTARNGFTRVSSLYKAAAVVGRAAGLAPQTPLTWKQIGVDAEWEELSDDQLDASLAAGVIVTTFDSELGYNLVLQDITTEQNNIYLVNDDGTSFNFAVKRIEAQLNKEMAIYIKKKFFGNQNAGPNRNTISEADLEAAVTVYLQSRIASTIQDDLIIRFDSVVATVNQDNYTVSYNFVPNFEVSKILIIGTLLES